MISKTWQGYTVSKRIRNSEFSLYVKSIYRGKVTWTTDETYAKHYTETAAKRIDAEIEADLLEGTFDNDRIVADAEAERKDKTMDRASINEIMKTIAEYTRMAEEAQKVADEQKEILKAYMAEADLTELLGDEHKVTWKEVVQNRFDSTAFKKDHSDMYEAYRKPSTTRPFKFA